MKKDKKDNNKNNILKKEIDNEKLKVVVLYFLAFFIPILSMLAIFIALKVYPFGENTYMPADAYGQYSNYLQYFRDIFIKGNSIIYSLTKSLGGEMYGLIAYYLISPYNFITLLFQKGNMTFAYDIILILKMASAGVTFTYYINRRKKAEFKNLIYAMMYVFSAYVITYGFNIMWLDSIILFPLVIAGLDDLTENKKFVLYTVSLTLTIFTNYYMGFMVCIFSVIYFIYKICLGKLTPKKELLKKIGIFIVVSIISALIASVVLIPVYKGLVTGRADFSFAYVNLKPNFKIQEILSKFFTNTFDIEEIKNDSLPPLYVGVLGNILVLLYFLNSKVTIKEKILSFIMFTIFILSYYISGLNILWTMGNIPAWYRFRYAFMFSFMYIIFAKKGLDNLKDGIKIWKIILVIFIYHLIAYFVLKQDIRYVINDAIKFDMICALFIGILLIFITLKIEKTNKGLLGFMQKHYTKITFFLIIALNTTGIVANTIYSVNIIRRDSSIVDQATYATYLNMYEDTIKKIQEKDNTLYRIEKKEQLTMNDALNLGYNGITYSASTYSKTLHEFLGKLGMRQMHVHMTYNMDVTQSVNMLLGIKYLIVPESKNKKNLEEYNVREEVKDEENAEFYKNFNVYKTKYPLSLGYGVSEELKNVDTETNNTFKLQNEILKNMTNIEKDVYKRHNGEIKEEITGINKKGYIYQRENADAEIKYEFEVEDTKRVYVFLVGVVGLKAKVYCNDEYLGEYFNSGDNEIIDLGKRNVGEKVTLKLKPSKDVVYIKEKYIYYEDEEILNEQYQNLKDEEVNLKKIDDTNYEGTVNLQNDKYVLFTIPYDEGWEVTVDGKKVEYEKMLDVFSAVKVDKGSHIIHLSYTLPRNRTR